MVYGSEAILPTDLDYGAPRVHSFDEQGNQMAVEYAMDQIDEARDVALLYSVKYQQAFRWYHDRNIKSWGFNVAELVLHRIQSSKGRRKLSPHGTGHSSSHGSFGQAPTSSRPQTAKKSVMQGTSHNYVNSTPKKLCRFPSCACLSPVTSSPFPIVDSDTSQQNPLQITHSPMTWRAGQLFPPL